jgi:hypothetical protein
MTYCSMLSWLMAYFNESWRVFSRNGGNQSCCLFWQWCVRAWILRSLLCWEMSRKKWCYCEEKKGIGLCCMTLDFVPCKPISSQTCPFCTAEDLFKIVVNRYRQIVLFCGMLRTRCFLGRHPAYIFRLLIYEWLLTKVHGRRSWSTLDFVQKTTSKQMHLLTRSS